MPSSQAIIRPVILCGGAGTRLWPVSRQQFPKHLLPVTGEHSLLQQTALRLTGDQFAAAVVVSGEEQRFFIKRQLESSGAPLEAILLEPVGRNTSAAAALAAAWLCSKGSDELMLLVPSDHVIANRQAFLDAVAAAVPHAQKGAIVTFGAKPSEPNTQYGYIEANTEGKFGDGTFPIARFHEKPDRTRAAEYLASGRFFWNCGIFLVKASTLVYQMQQFLPESLEAIEKAVRDGTADGGFIRPSAEAFARAENVSIDVGIMERTDRGMVVPVDMDWSDVGAWDAVWKLAAKDSDQNVVHGNVVALDTRGSLLRNDSSAVLTAIGLHEMAVIAASDAIFVAPMNRVSEVKDLVAKLAAQERDITTLPAKVSRPWGSYETVAEGPGFQVKHIVVDAGERLSLQMHHHRSEHWVVVRGSAEVTVGEAVSILKENESTYIPVATKHRLANPGEVPLEIVEIQCGPYLGEDDIVRFEDQYGRASPS
ncbi:MAG TPA: mannose-1-phosphate guanylyltransferase/mannose-6-phosphate isomerase [Sphingomicrobium sp.]|nr:mannose-1-phosphate guanylyltransferase/mannose-6-phosphate isomerase [Sphingomicrobium sp.]